MKNNTQDKINCTLAWGFKVDFSEENEPIDELGDKPGQLEVGATAPNSEVDDAELPGHPGDVADCDAPCVFTGAASAESSLGKLIFSRHLDDPRDVRSYEVAFGDNFRILGPSFFALRDDCKSA